MNTTNNINRIHIRSHVSHARGEAVFKNDVLTSGRKRRSSNVNFGKVVFSLGPNVWRDI